MKENVKKLKLNIEFLEERKEELKIKQEQFEKDNHHLIEIIRQLSEEQNNFKEEIKVSAIVLFKETGDKKLFGGIGIREGISLNYDRGMALAWAKEHLLCLNLDVKSFEKIAKTQNLDFVKQEEKITVTFPRIIEYEQKGDDRNGR